MARNPELNVSEGPLRELPPDAVSARLEAANDYATNEPIARPRVCISDHVSS
jgi:hypothetical protein